jgi:hypothetical protein
LFEVQVRILLGCLTGLGRGPPNSLEHQLWEVINGQNTWKMLWICLQTWWLSTLIQDKIGFPTIIVAQSCVPQRHVPRSLPHRS